MSSEHSVHIDVSAEARGLGPLARTAALASGVAGVVLLGAAWALSGEPARFFQSYYVAFCFVLSISLGALFFTLLHNLVGAKWSIVVRRPAEVLAANLLVVAILFVPLLLAIDKGLIRDGAATLHDQHGDAATSHASAETGNQKPEASSVHGRPKAELLPKAKAFFLSRGFTYARYAIYFLVWAGLGLLLWGRSVAHDESGAASILSGSRVLSGPGMVAFALTTAFGAIDLLMSLNPHWHSTIFGVYFFAGSAVAFFATLPLVVMALQRTGRLKQAVTTEHFHDMGKLLFAFVFFWSYIAFSQYMLIWYADSPEETGWFMKRASPSVGGLTEGWNGVAMVLLLGHWLVPFVVLLSRDVKRCRMGLAFWCVWMLVLHYVDLYWIARPEWSAQVPFSVADVACLLGLAGVYVAGALAFSGSRAVLPVKDPHLTESLAFENF